MIYAFDSYYRNGEIRTAGVGFMEWDSEMPTTTFAVTGKVESEYISGQFYKRELPGLLQVIESIDLKSGDILVIDGYVYLDNNQANGLGGYLYEALQGAYPVIGVAKKHFKSLTERVQAVHRGRSKKPLYVTAKGLDVDAAADCVRNMYGPYRIPNVLKYVDQLSKDW